MAATARGVGPCLFAVALALTTASTALGQEPAAPDPPAATAPTGPRPTPAPALDPRAIEWRWPAFRTGEYFATAGFAAASLASLAIPTGPAGRWTATNSFDLSIRKGLRASSRAGREAASDVSDVLVAVELNQVLFDSIVVAWKVHDRGSVATQMLLLDFEAFTFTQAVTSILKNTVARQRPYFAECDGDSLFARGSSCSGSDRYHSFVSSHSASAFTAAGLTCIHHAYLPLYGGGAGDTTACITALVAAGVTGTMRVVADEHYPTDVLAGAAIGLASGLGIPWILHYQFKPPTSNEKPHPVSGFVMFTPTANGAALFGAY